MTVNIVSFVIIMFLIFHKADINGRKDILSKDDTNSIKGIAALFIFYAHFYNGLIGTGMDVGIGKLWLLTGGMGVGLFFFLSGYGLNKSNGIIRQNFLLRRVKSVLVPFVIIRMILYVIDLLQGKEQSVVSAFWYAIRESNWFVTLILIIYVGYYICFKLFGREHLNSSVLIYNIVIGIIFIMLDLDPKWYNSHLLFSLGMYMADYNDRVINFTTGKKWQLKCGCGLIGFLCCSILFTCYKGALWSNVFKTLAGACMCFLVFCIMGRLRLNSPILQWIGKNSLLVFMLHLPILNMLQANIEVSGIGLLLISLAITFGGIGLYNLSEYGIKQMSGSF